MQIHNHVLYQTEENVAYSDHFEYNTIPIALMVVVLVFHLHTGNTVKCSTKIKMNVL